MAAQCLYANTHDVDKCAEPRAKPNAAVRPADPDDAHFYDAEPGALRQKQQLDIKGEAVDRQAREQRHRRFAAEQLEPALCVVDPR
jgi:hypothetical protein